MKRNTKNAGFTLIELMIVVAIIAIIAAIAIPKLMSARISANENAAVATLRSIASAQHQLESACAIDTDADGGGEFGYFGELTGMASMRVYGGFGVGAILGGANDVLDPPILPTAFGDIVADVAGDGIVERQGYYFKMWLPGPTAGGVTPGVAETTAVGASGFPGGSPAVLPDSDNCEILWACYAWPVDAEKTGTRVFFINQEGDLLQFQNRGVNLGVDLYEGTTGPAFDAAFSNASAGDMSTDLGITAMGFTANDNNIWTVVGN